MLGKTAVEIVSKIGAQVEYRWLENSSEVLALHNGRFDIMCLLFSGSVWGDVSYCTGVLGMELFSIEIPEDIKRLPELYGEGAVWQEALNGEEAYYQYVFDDNIEVRFHANPEGTRLTGTMLVKSAGTEELNGGTDLIMPYDYDPAYQPPALTDKAEWQNPDKYISCIDKTPEDIMVDFPKSEYRTESRSYEDSDSGMEFRFSTDNTCSWVAIPAPLIFPDMGAQMTREELTEHWPGNHTWEVYASYCRYVYVFEDVTVFVDSNIDGSVPAAGYVHIMKSEPF